MVKKSWRKPLTEPQLVGENVYQLLLAMGGSPERGRLSQLWVNWRQALGEELAAMATPLGSRGRILLIRAEDAMQMQELHFLCEDLLARVNGFLGSEYFASVRLTLFGNGKICRVEEIRMQPEKKKPYENARLTGQFLAMMDKKSPVAACYARFVRR